MATKHLRTPQRRQDYLSRIFTLGEIDSDNTNEIIGLIYEVNREDKIKEPEKRDPIRIIVNCPGGLCYDGFGIIDVMESSLTPIHTIIHGQASSMGFAIAASGHYRFASKRAVFMLHEISWYGDYEKLQYHEQEIIEGRRTWKVYENIITEKTKIPLKKIQMVRERKKEWYMTSQEALNLGVIDEILE